MLSKFLVFFLLIFVFLTTCLEASYDVFTNQAANTFMAAPNGVGGTMSPRLIVAADIPALPYASSTLASGKIYVGSGGNVATAQTMSGDATISNAGALTLASVVGAGSCTSCNVTFDAKGRATAFANGSGGGGSAQYAMNAQVGVSYTLVLTDGYSNGNFPLLTSSNAAPQTITVPPHASVAFPVGERVPIHQLGTGFITVAGGAGVTLNSANGFVTGAPFSFISLIQTAIDTWSVIGDHMAGFISATGGTITTVGNFKVHTFTSSGTFQVTSGYGMVDSLVVAGGGGGGHNAGGGGGAGGLIYTSPGASYGVGAYTVTVGAGGAGSTSGASQGVSGANSVFDVVTAAGGGGGGSNGGAVNGNNGGSGGGGAFLVASGSTGGTGTGGQGNNGGTGELAGVDDSAGGGGGCNAAGGNATLTVGGAGGNGCSNSISGGAVTYAGGGGGGSTGTAGTGGSGGGGAGNTGGNGFAATANTGGGGGGAPAGFDGGAGGSGVVIVTYQFQ